MSRISVNGVIFFIILVPFLALHFLNKIIISTKILYSTSSDFDWIFNGSRNLLGYSTLIIPCYLAYLYIQKIDYLDKPSSGFMATILKWCFLENNMSLISTNHLKVTSRKKTYWQRVLLLIFYFMGLQASYLMWGIIQEKVMTQVYHSNEGKVEYFGDSQFLVFVNRVLAFVVSGLILMCRGTQKHKCPLYKYIFCSLSNIMSSWCQYEALKYVSFPNQVLAKAGKTVPVMLMGKLVSKTQYKYYEYITSITLSIGMLLFMVDVGNDRAKSVGTTVSGAILLVSYVTFDSFTSNWQSALFKTYTLSPIEMMCYVNFFSFILTGTSLIQQSSFYSSLAFIIKYPTFSLDCLILSICSAFGQLFIFCTISEFGPLIFVIISIIRQCLSVLLSCILYNHEIHALGVVGLSFVFWSVFLRSYCSYRKEQKRLSRLKTNTCGEDQKF
ncbi:hypothetical protein WA026_007083 [Henosepilachna vigintioctopunctata]|uniref:Adenosine 3'-phospho 5'-phosphosulfate transporter 1 n=1 Tax=Henosepilachna vigintioctopunctata TaxID=420089 RepID=A0AAW1VCF6_9CUCU